MLRFTVIIVTMNRARDLRVALGSLEKQTRHPEEVLIVDQSTSDDTKTVFSEFEPRFAERKMKLIYAYQEEKSAVKARNRGISMATGDVIGFIDDDAELFPDYYEKIAGYFERHPEVGSLSGNTLMPPPPKGLKAALRRAVMHLFLLSHYDGRLTASGFGFPIVDREIDGVIDVELLPGCNMNFRSEIVKKEKFDEWFVGYAFREDAEFTYRASRHAKSRMLPDAKLYHHYSPAARLNVKALKEMELRNYRYVFQKHKKGFLSEVFFLYSYSGLFLINLLEYLVSLDPKDLDCLKGHVNGIRSLLKEGVGEKSRRVS